MCGFRLKEELPTALESVLAPIPEPLLENGIGRTALAPTKSLVGERRIVSVILADVQSSTDLLERIGTEAWVEIMNRVFQLLETEIYRFGGQVDQFRGDGLVAFFGASIAHEDDPERAVLAALAMQRAMRDYAEDLKTQLDVELKLRVGINTGEVIVTSIGEQGQHREDTAMGEAIAIASRMETAAEPGTILVSDNTYQLLQSRFRWQPLGEILVKGVSVPIPVYRPLEYFSAPDEETRSLDFRFATSLTGRDTEFKLISRCLEDLYGGRGGITIITGETGLGKTFLVTKAREHFLREEVLRAEARQQAQPGSHNNGAKPELTWLTGNCRSYDQNWPYSMWLDMLQKWLYTSPDESAETIRARLHEEALSLWGDNLPEFYPYLATFLSLPLEETYHERVRHLDAESLQRQFRLAIRSWVEKMTLRGPMVVVLNDLHWADSSGLDLLRFCLTLADSQSLLWIITMRPDRNSAAWELRQHIETEYPHRLIALDLQPLSDKEITKLVNNVIGCSGLSDETRQMIVQKSDGNPYYVQELVRALISQGALALDSETGCYLETRSVANLDLPDSLQNLILARIDRTNPEERRVLQMAAVIGQVFWWNILESLAGNTRRLKANLTSLQRSELIAERSLFPILGMEYEFNSALIREVAYEGLLNSQRVNFHTRVANFLEESTGLEGWAQYYSLIAYHYHCAGNSRKELFYTLQAAEQARKIYANAEAYRAYTSAIQLLDGLETEGINVDQRYVIYTQRFEVLKGRGEVCYTMGNIPEGQEDLRALLPLARKMEDDPAWMIDAILMQPEVSHPDTQTLLQSALEMGRQALALAEQINDLDRQLKSLMAIANLQRLLRDPQSNATIERALELARRLGNRSAEADLLLHLGSALGMDNLVKMQEYLEAALNISYELDDRKKEINLLHLIGEQFERSGDYFVQLKEYEEKRLQIAQEIGDRLDEAHALMYCGQIRGIYLGDYANGLALEERSAQIWEKTLDRLYPILRQSQMQIELGHFKDAQKTLEAIRPTVEQSVLDVGRVGYILVWAIFNNALGGQEHLYAVLELTQRIHQMAWDNLVSRQYQLAASCQASAAHLELAELAGNADDAQQHISQALDSSGQALDLYMRFGFVRVAECVSEEVFYRHSLALSAHGRTEEAAEYLKKAYEEMMRKHDLIPDGSPFRKSFLENIRLHRSIQSLYKASQPD
jgi:class 3 adenylate cyclase/tetratricopeptide (TPR) repeat protein